MRRTAGSLVVAVLWMVVASSCARPPQELPVVVSVVPGDETLQWRDAHGPLLGEVPWVVRSDLRGPDTRLVVDNGAGEMAARKVSFRVLAGGSIEYDVTLSADGAGSVRWNVGYGEGQKMRLFSCDPRPAHDEKNECTHGGVPKPLLGTLVGEISAELEDGRVVDDVRSLRFERAVPSG